jgi:DNA-binding MarR family transcriptional regulator
MATGYFGAEIFVNELFGVECYAGRVRDSVDQHLDKWMPLIPDLDRHVEGAVTRMQFLVAHLRRIRQVSLAEHGLQDFEYETLHALGGRGEPYRAGPTQLAVETQTSPAAMTGRLDGLEKRGFIRRLPSATDRRKVIVELTDAGREIWLAAMSGTGVEEARLMEQLTRREQKQLDDLLRRMLVAAEERPST